MTQVYPVPGFFGFTELGSFNYFHRVSEVLGQALKERGVDAEIIETETVPTGSIRRRARRLIQSVRMHGGLEQDGLHFIGHSTGGLDTRMLPTPGVQRLEDGHIPPKFNFQPEFVMYAGPCTGTRPARMLHETSL